VLAVIQVRPATVDDIPAMVDILAAVAAERMWIGMEAPIDRPLRVRQFTATIEGEGAVFAAAVAETVIGHLWLHGTSGVVGLGMAVRDGWRGKGVGRHRDGLVLDETSPGSPYEDA
jgi:GNAT superfamily N-acetyltransferase